MYRYISYRQSYAHHPTKRNRYATPGGKLSGPSGVSSLAEERQGLMSGAGLDNDDAIIEMDVLPPRWLDIQDEVVEMLETVSRQMAQLEPMHAKHVLPGFEDDAVKQKEEREIEKLTQEITRGFQSCQRSIKRIETMVKQQPSISRADETMARNLQISLAGRVGDLSAKFRKRQATYLKKLRQLSGMGSPMDRSSTPMQSTYMDDPSLFESNEDRSFSQSTLRQTQKRRTGNDTVIAQREREIEDIARGIIDLANIFQELQTMIVDQGTMLDRIDYNIERMAVDVKGADKELKVATGYQKKTTRRKIILLLILIVVGLIILLAIKLRRSASPPPAPESPASDEQPP